MPPPTGKSAPARKDPRRRRACSWTRWASGNYGGVHKGLPVVTNELPSALLTPRNVEIQRMWTDLRQWMGVMLAGVAAEEPVQR